MIRAGYPAGRIYLAGDGVDVAALERIPPDPEIRAPYGSDYLVGGFGRLSWKKNWMLMVRAAEILARESFPVQWVLAGDGPDRAGIAAAIKPRDWRNASTCWDSAPTPCVCCVSSTCCVFRRAWKAPP